MSPAQSILAVMLGCFFVAGIFQFFLMTAMWSGRTAWIVPAMVFFYVAGVAAGVDLAFWLLRS